MGGSKGHLKNQKFRTSSTRAIAAGPRPYPPLATQTTRDTSGTLTGKTREKLRANENSNWLIHLRLIVTDDC